MAFSSHNPHVVQVEAERPRGVRSRGDAGQGPRTRTTFRDSCVHKRTAVAGGGRYDADGRKETIMLSTLVVVLLVLWVLGIVTSYTMGGLIHILLIVAIVVVLLRVIQGRNPIRG